MSRLRSCVVSLCVVVLAAGCMSPKGEDAHAKRQAAQKMRQDTLAELYRIRPGARGAIARAAGYAVFSNLGVNVIFFSAGNGWGVARDNRTGRYTYMKMITGGLGLGLGVKDFRAVFVFTSRGALRDFVDHGWDASAQADAAAKVGNKGGAFAGAIDVAPGIKLYQITKNGLALQATIQGTKYWRDGDLNG